VTGEASYELPYGPLVFLLHAATFTLLGRSVVVLKLPGIVANLAACALVFSVLRRRASLRCASGGALVLGAYLAYYDARTYWCRPEPFLLLGAALALWLARARPRATILLHALLVAWMVDLKITGILYVVPVLVLVAEQRGAGRAIAAALLGGALALSVFALPALSLGAYVGVLLKTARHGISARELALNVTAAVVLLGPALLVRALRVRGAPVPPQRASWRVATGALVACVAVTCVVAAKPGAGRHHLLPLLPLVLDALVDGVDGIERGRVGAHAARALTLLARATLATIVVASAWASAQSLSRRAARVEASRRELRALLARYDGVPTQMGYGDASSYEDTYDRLLVAFHQPLRLDAASQMDSAASGYPASRMLAGELASCAPRIWIVPRGAPFTLPSYYSGAPVFDDAFRRAFARRWEPVEDGAYYRVFRCRDPSTDG
jgi:hypothetical protein